MVINLVNSISSQLQQKCNRQKAVGPAGQRLDVARVLKETLCVSSVQVLRVLRLADSHDKSYILSLRPCKVPATTLYFSIVVSFPRCQDDLHVLTLVHDSEVLLHTIHLV